MRHYRRRRKVVHEDTNRWIISYADFITLLFAFFVVMYAISSVNLDKYKHIAKTLDDSFRPNKLNTKSYLIPIIPKTEEPLSDKTGESMQLMTENLKYLDDKFAEILKRKKWVELKIKSHSLFENGQSDLSPEALKLLNQVGEVLKKSNYSILIEGHTDNRPIQTNQFRSNWELSATRAATVARVLSETGIDPRRISAIGYGDQFPIADNATEEGRSQNRRVSIIISKDKQSKRFLNPSLAPDVQAQDQKNHTTTETTEE